MKKNILICTGGSGGHVIPAMSFYEHFEKEFNVYLSSDKRGLNYIDDSIDQNRVKLINIPRFSKNIFKIPYVILIFIISFFDSIFYLNKKKINFLVSTGGYMSIPMCLSAKLLGIKIFLFEPNLVIGRSNNFFLGISKKIICYSEKINNFPQAQNHKKFIIHSLFRRKLYEIKKNDQNIKETFKILIIGGSQGADFFDNKMTNIMIDIFKKKKISIIQQITDENKKISIQKQYNDLGIQSYLFGYDKNLFQNYNKIDLAITRAGASTLSELFFFNIPFVAIPLPTSKDNHQLFNANYYKDRELSWVINQKDCNHDSMVKFILDLIDSPQKILNKKQKMNKLSYHNTWNNINQRLIGIINEN